MINAQLPEAKDVTPGDTVDLHSIWHTLQGEGPFTGKPAIFIRLAGCNLQCPMCDTEYTKSRQRVPVSHIVDSIVYKLGFIHANTSLIVITGGEPTRQNIDFLIERLLKFDYHVQIESNGVLSPSPQFMQWVSEGFVTYIVSPKTKRVCKEASRASAFKYVLSADSIREEDGLPIQALGHRAVPFIARPPEHYTGDIYVNPMDTSDPVANQKNLLACRDSALKFGYTMGVQLHKIVGVA